MPHAENKVKWCLKKAEKELQQGDKHRGLIKIKPDQESANAHTKNASHFPSNKLFHNLYTIKKAEHNLKAITDFHDIGYSDWSASAAFYSVYHCFLSIIAKFGYARKNRRFLVSQKSPISVKSRNQECTFALIYNLIETKQIKLNKEAIQEIHSLNPEEKQELPTIVEVRENGQYSIKLSIEDGAFNRLLETTIFHSSVMSGSSGICCAQKPQKISGILSVKNHLQTYELPIMPLIYDRMVFDIAKNILDQTKEALEL